MPFQTPAWDLDLLILINQHGRHALLDFIMPLFSNSLLLWVLGSVAAFPVLIKRRIEHLIPILCLVLAVGLADTGSNVLKSAFERTRPHKAVAGTYSLAKKGWKQTPELPPSAAKESGTSYPSAHAANTMALALLAVIFWPKARPWLLVLPLIVGYSRVYLGKHYPLDVLAGWLWGASAALFLYLAWLQWNEWSKRPTARRENSTST